MVAKNKKAPAQRKAEDDHLLTTKLFCGYCGSLMFGRVVPAVLGTCTGTINA